MVISANFFRLSHLASNEAFLNFFADSQLSLLGIIFFLSIDKKYDYIHELRNSQSKFIF